MKKLLTLLSFLSIAATSEAQFLNSPPTIDASVGSGEYLNNSYNGNGNGTWHVGWDDTYLYVALTGANETEGAILYIDEIPNQPVTSGADTDGNLTSPNDYNSTPQNLPFRADVRIFIRNSTREIQIKDNAGVWVTVNGLANNGLNGGGTDDYTAGFYASHDNGNGAGVDDRREMKVRWADMNFGGRPEVFNWFGYITFGSGVYSNVPVNNVINTNDVVRYFSVVGSSSNAISPFEKESYTHNGQANNAFGAVTFYDFTHSRGNQITAAGNWTINNDLVITNAGLLYNSASANNFNIIGDLIIKDNALMQTSDAILISAFNVLIEGGQLNHATGSGQLFTVSNDLMIMDNAALNNGSVTLSGNSPLSVGGDLTVSNTNGDASLTLAPGNLGMGGDLYVDGDFTVNGEFTCNDRAVFFNGAVITQNIVGDAPITIDYFLINSPNITVELGVDVNVTKEVDLGINGGPIRGKINLANSDLILSEDALFDGTFGENAHVIATDNGKIVKAFSDLTLAPFAFSFPLGDGTNYSPLLFTVNSITGGGEVSTNLTDAIYNQFPTAPTHYLTRYWTVEGTSFTALDYTAEFSYIQADVVGTETELKGFKFNGSSGQIHPSAVNTGANTITFSGLTSFSAFTAADASVLPIELAALKAKNDNGNVSLDWITNCEKGSDRFEIERSTNGKDWTKLGSLKAKGYCTTASEYNYMDNAPANGVNYYRLKMLDVDGKFSFSNIVNATIQKAKGSFTLSPNPTFDRLNLSIPQNGKYNLFDISGKNIENGTLQGTQLNVQQLQSGVYFLKVNNETLRFVKQ